MNRRFHSMHKKRMAYLPGKNKKKVAYFPGKKNKKKVGGMAWRSAASTHHKAERFCFAVDRHYAPPRHSTYLLLVLFTNQGSRPLLKDRKILMQRKLFGPKTEKASRVTFLI